MLIDLRTAGAAEVVASAVLDRKLCEVIGEQSFGAGTEQKLFPCCGGAGYLLTVAKWASPNGTPFLGEERTTTGVQPSVKVKRPDTPEPLDVESLGEQPDSQNPQPNPTPVAKPVQPKTVEDIQLKRALELMQDKAAAAKVGSGN